MLSDFSASMLNNWNQGNFQTECQTDTLKSLCDWVRASSSKHQFESPPYRWRLTVDLYELYLPVWIVFLWEVTCLSVSAIQHVVTLCGLKISFYLAIFFFDIFLFEKSKNIFFFQNFEIFSRVRILKFSFLGIF